MRILVIEDDLAVRTLIKVVLEHNGHDVTSVGTAKEGKEAALTNEHDVIILDLGLPDGNGFDVCNYIRENGLVTPILVLSGEKDIDIKVKLLNAGGDDYITKPFDNGELLARIAAITRRSHASQSQELVCEELKINLIDRNCTVNGNPIQLTNNEFDLLVYFMNNRNEILSQEEIASKVWGIEFDTQTNYINVYISYIRKKIGEFTERSFIETVRGKGFIFRC